MCHSSSRFLGAASASLRSGTFGIGIRVRRWWECSGKAAGVCASSDVNEYLHGHEERAHLASCWSDINLQVALSTSVCTGANITSPVNFI